MGGSSSKRVVEGAHLYAPTGLYPKDSDGWEVKDVRKLIESKKLAPRWTGVEEAMEGSREECPICCLYYPTVNITECCRQRICSECYLQLSNPKKPPSKRCCPFCKRSSFQVHFFGRRKEEDLLREEQENMHAQELERLAIVERERQRSEEHEKNTFDPCDFGFQSREEFEKVREQVQGYQNTVRVPSSRREVRDSITSQRRQTRRYRDSRNMEERVNVPRMRDSSVTENSNRLRDRSSRARAREIEQWKAYIPEVLQEDFGMLSSEDGETFDLYSAMLSEAVRLSLAEVEPHFTPETTTSISTSPPCPESKDERTPLDSASSLQLGDASTPVSIPRPCLFPPHSMLPSTPIACAPNISELGFADVVEEEDEEVALAIALQLSMQETRESNTASAVDETRHPSDRLISSSSLRLSTSAVSATLSSISSTPSVSSSSSSPPPPPVLLSLPPPLSHLSTSFPPSSSPPYSFDELPPSPDDFDKMSHLNMENNTCPEEKFSLSSRSSDTTTSSSSSNELVSGSSTADPPTL